MVPTANELVAVLTLPKSGLGVMVTLAWYPLLLQTAWCFRASSPGRTDQNKRPARS